MFIHAVLLELQPGAGDELFERLTHFCRRIPHETWGLHSLHFGPNLAARSDGYGHCVIGHFASSAAHDAFQICDAHQEMKACLMPHVARLCVLDAVVADPAP